MSKPVEVIPRPTYRAQNLPYKGNFCEGSAPNGHVPPEDPNSKTQKRKRAKEQPGWDPKKTRVV